MKPILAIVFSTAVALSAAAAQDGPRDGVYVRAGAGVSFIGDLEQEFTYNPDLVFIGTPPTGQIVETETGFTASAAIGFDYADGIRTELEYRYATNGVDLITPVGAIPAAPPFTSDDDLNAHFVFTNFFYDIRTDSMFTPFVGAGVGGAFVGIGNGERDAALAYQGRAGVSTALNDGFSVDVEYVYTRTNTLRYGPDPDDFTPTGPIEPAVDGDNYEASTVMVSLRKQF